MCKSMHECINQKRRNNGDRSSVIKSCCASVAYQIGLLVTWREHAEALDLLHPHLPCLHCRICKNIIQQTWELGMVTASASADAWFMAADAC